VSIHYFRFTLTDPADPQRAPLLERLLARADVSREAKDWRADAFRVLAPQAIMPGVGPAAWCGQRSDGLLPEGIMPGATVFMATPVHYVAEMSNVRLAPDGVLALERPEADRLAADFKRVWSDAGVRLAVGRRADLFCIMDQSPAAATCDPVDVLGRHIENYLPTGEGAPRLRRLMSEIEMWLFEHEVNRGRSAVGAPVVNGLWLWGGGPALSSLPPIEGWTAGKDPLFAAWTGGADAGAGARAGTPPASQATSGVAVVVAQPGTAEWDDLESNWLQASCRALRARRIERLELSAGHRAWSVTARWRWRMWRRPRPWWECFT
jgi:hypothetical protein